MTLPNWRDAVVSDDGTHHRLGADSLYPTRFDEVLKFHAPGLAPARDASGAYHIDVEGRPAYTSRFRRTFGFYEGLAAVVTDEGWTHIRVDGSPLSTARWAWTGNFQGGRCTVRDRSGHYGHLDHHGAPIYGLRYRYAGDFRDGIAVVQRDDGHSTHIDASGVEVHGRWYVDLDVFHKGFARARDEDGWMHVDREGQPVYRRRFAAVEPFYNGQARVEREDGGLEVIDEAGGTLVELRPARRSALQRLSSELVSFWRCEAIYAAVDAGLFERLPVSDADLNEAQRRLLGALAEMGLVEREGGRWMSTDSGALLRGDHPQSLVPAARYWARDGRRDWAALPLAVADARWRPTDPFAAASADPALVRGLQAALAPYAVHDYQDIGGIIEPGRRVIDAGGGSGALSVALVRAQPDTQSVVLDRPEVAAVGEIPEDLLGRIEFVGADIFAPWPVRGDTVVLARVLHDWADDRAIEILRRARESVDANGRLYLVEFVRPTGGHRGGLLSLHLLLSTGGRERTADDFHELLRRSGWKFQGVRRHKTVVDVVVASVGFVVPEPTLEALRGAPEGCATILLLRHSARGPIPAGDAGNDVLLLPEGKVLARELGRLIGGRLRTVESSPVTRCMETAECLVEGAGVGASVVADRFLGHPGVYVEDDRAAWTTWSSLGHDRVMGHLVAGDRLPGLADPISASQRLVAHMRATAAGRDGVHVFITHDSIVTTAAAHVLGVPLGKADWPWYLEALVLVDGEDGATATYRGRTGRVPW